MKLWQKDYNINKQIETFTVGNDREMDLFLAPYDVLGSLAHIAMLCEIGLLEKNEHHLLAKELKKIYFQAKNGEFSIDAAVEDVHSQVEFLLTAALGDMGKKIHSGRSRNDQVLVDLKLYFRAELEDLTRLIEQLFNTLIAQSEQYKNVLIPGYTHLQVAMVSSFGLWFGAYAETLVDDLMQLQSTYKIVNQNPLGSGAGYGGSLPLNRKKTTTLLGFDDLNYNVVHAQMGRGKAEHFMSFSLAAIGHTLSKLAMDVCLFMNQNFDFMTLPKELTTGSSIMPHKKNPDVFELIRGKSNRLMALPAEVGTFCSNLPSGYHRDFQLLKEVIFPAIQEAKSCLEIANFMLQNVIVKKNIIKDKKYLYLFSVEEVNKLVLSGVPFRDAYKIIGEQIESETFKTDYKIKHTHEGSLGNLSNRNIKAKMNRVMKGFGFEKVEKQVNNLLSGI